MKYIKTFACLFLFISTSIFAQQYSFESYRMKKYTGPQAKLLIKDNELAQRYRTTITDTYNSNVRITKWHGKGGINFAGHYCFVYWGCGSDCQHGAIVDVKTGKVYDGPTAGSLFEYKPWSRLLIVNARNPKNNCAFCKTEYWVLNETTKRFTQIK